jgi:hypothetical protein
MIEGKKDPISTTGGMEAGLMGDRLGAPLPVRLDVAV